MKNLSLEQLESMVGSALALGYDDSYYNSNVKTKQKVLDFFDANDIPTEQAMLLNCAYGVGTLMGRNDK